MQNSIKATKDHCKYCFEVLLAKLTNKALPPWPNKLSKVSVPLFVTWKIAKNDELRGCIGTFSEQDIQKALPQYVIISALQDTRFNPISIEEVESLSVSVSLLVNFQKNKKAYDWQVGKHGIQIEFNEKNKHFRSTYLPQVAAEQKWNQDQTLKSLIRKAGFRGDYKDVLNSINLTTYESSKEQMSYEEYKATINQ